MDEDEDWQDTDDSGEGGFEAFLDFLLMVGYLIIVVPINWLAQRVWKLRD